MLKMYSGKKLFILILSEFVREIIKNLNFFWTEPFGHIICIFVFFNSHHLSICFFFSHFFVFFHFLKIIFFDHLSGGNVLSNGNVEVARKKLDDAVRYSCHQRADGNTSEWFPTFLTFALMGGVVYPASASFWGECFPKSLF